MFRANIHIVLLCLGGFAFAVPVTQESHNEDRREHAILPSGLVGEVVDAGNQLGNDHSVVEKRQPDVHNRLISLNISDESETRTADKDESRIDWNLHLGTDQDSLHPEHQQTHRSELGNRGEQGNNTDSIEHGTGAIHSNIDNQEETGEIASEPDSNQLESRVYVTEEPLDQVPFTQSLRELPNDNNEEEYLSPNLDGLETDGRQHQIQQESGVDGERESMRGHLPESGHEQSEGIHLEREPTVTPTSRSQYVADTTIDALEEHAAFHEEKNEEHEVVFHLPEVTDGEVLPTNDNPLQPHSTRRTEPTKKEEHLPIPKPETAKGHLPIGEGKLQPVTERVVPSESSDQNPVVPSTPLLEPTEGPRHLPFDEGGLAPNTPKLEPTEGPRHLPHDQGGIAANTPNPEPTEATRHLPYDQGTPNPEPTEAPRHLPYDQGTPNPEPTEAPRHLPTSTPKPEPTEGPRHLPHDQGGLNGSSTTARLTNTPRHFPPDEASSIRTTLAPEPVPTENNVHQTEEREITREVQSSRIDLFPTTHYTEVTEKLMTPDEEITEAVQQEINTESIVNSEPPEITEQIPEVMTEPTLQEGTVGSDFTQAMPDEGPETQPTTPFNESSNLNEITNDYHTEQSRTMDSVETSTVGGSSVADKVNENGEEILKTTRKATAKPTRKHTSDYTSVLDSTTTRNTYSDGIETESFVSASINPTKSTPEIQTSSKGKKYSSSSEVLFSSANEELSLHSSDLGSTPMMVLSTTGQTSSDQVSVKLSPWDGSRVATDEVSLSTEYYAHTSKLQFTETQRIVTTGSSIKFAEVSDSSAIQPSKLSTLTSSTASSHTGEHDNVRTTNLVQLPVIKDTKSVSNSEKPEVYIDIDMKMRLTDFCELKPNFLQEVVNILLNTEKGELTQENIKMQYPGQDDCDQQWGMDRERVNIQIYILDKTGKLDISMTIDLAKHLKPGIQSNKEFGEKLTGVKIVGKNETDLKQPPELIGNTPSYIKEEEEIETGIVIAITIASVGGFCCVCLLVLQIVIHRRSGKKMQPYSFGGSICSSRLSNRSLNSAIALNDVSKSRPNSGLWNPGLDLEDEVCREPSHPLVYSALTDFALETESIHLEFQRIPNETPRLSCVPIGAEEKNRFANVLPFPHSRVRLKKIPGEECSDYINANYITGYKNDLRAYIATQAPLSSTAVDLWRMVWEQQSRCILMLTDMDERGKPRCIPYWPDKTGMENRVMYGDFCITLKKKEIHQEYIVSVLDIKDIERNLVREIRHFWYTCWPTDSTPEPISLVKFVLDTRPYYEDSGAPVIVHCSPGTGRTGTLIAIDICMRSFEDRRSVNILHTVYKMRKERAGTVQTKDQYNLIYKAVSEYAIVMNTPSSISTSSSVATLQNML